MNETGLPRASVGFESCGLDILKKVYSRKSLVHWHDYYELEVICGGSGNYRVNGKEYELVPMSAYIVTPKDFHEVEGRELVLYNLAFNSSMVSLELINRLENCSNDTVVLFEKERFSEIECILELMLFEYSQRKTDRDEALCSLLEYLLITVLRCPELKTPDSAQASTAVIKTLSYMKNNFRDSISLSKAAKEVHLSPNYLGDLFQKEIGVSFRQYLTHIRLAYAKNLLARSDSSIDRIAKDSGFSSSAYFSEAFRAKYSRTPTELRRSLQE